MTAEYQYQMAVDLATDMARATTREKVFVSTWKPFQLLYVELVKRKEITAIRDLDQATKERYWKEVCDAQPGAEKWKKICLWQSIYCYDLITEKK